MTETEIQSEFIKVVREYRDEYPMLYNGFHCPNEGRRSRRQAQIQKALGMESGIPDWFLAVPVYIDSGETDYYGGLWIEFKSSRGSLSASQQQWRQRLIAAGYKYAICRTWQGAWNEVCKYLSLEKLAISGHYK